MPEAVEVNWMAETINREIISQKDPCQLLEIKIISGRYITHSLPENYLKFNKLLKSEKIYLSKIQNKGKFIYLTFTNSEWSVWITLGMTGHLILEEEEYTRAIFNTSHGDFYLDDVRNFGTLTLYPNPSALDKKLSTLGPDILQDKSLTTKDFVDIMRKIKPNTIIAMALVDQKKISGIGNYLRAEILYEAKTNPFKILKDLTDAELKKIFKSAQKVVQESYDCQKKDGIHCYPFMVYTQKTDPKGNPVKGSKLPDKRTIWWSPTIQEGGDLATPLGE